MKMPVINFAYRKIFPQSVGNPLCLDNRDDKPVCRRFPLSNIVSPGILLQFFELKEVLIQKKLVKFYAQGICMYPCVQPGDILHLEYRQTGEIKLGEIAVYRRNNTLFGHRVIDKGRQGNLDYIITRPDTANKGDDGAIFSQDIAGVVVAIERKGRLLGPERIRGSFLRILRGWYFEASMKLKILFIENLAYPVAFVQSQPVYKYLARLFTLKIEKGLDFFISVPLSAKMDCLLERMLSCEELIDLGKNKDVLLKWKIVLNIRHKAVASLLFMRGPEGHHFSGWWIIGVKIAGFYRGTVVEEKLLMESEVLLKRLGAQRLSVALPRDDALNRIFCRSLGFKRASNSHSLNNNLFFLEKEI